MASRSKFFYESSESSSDEQSIVEEKVSKPVYRPRRTFEEADEESEQKRLVRTEKDKRYTELKAIIHNISNGKKINDFGRIFDSFDTLCKAFTKAKKVIDSEGIPDFYINAIVNLQNYVDDCWERDEGTWKRSLDKGTTKYLSILRQRIRKYNRDFEEQIRIFKEKASEFSEKDSEAEVSDNVEETNLIDDEPLKAANFIEADEAAEPEEEEVESGDSDDWGEYSSDDETSDSSIDVDDMDARDTYISFLKAEYREGREGLSSNKDRQTAKTLKKRKKRDEGREEEKHVDDDGWEEVREGLSQATEKPTMFDKDEEVNHETVIKKSYDILQSRGKRGFNPEERCSLLIELRGIAKSKNLGNGIDLFLLFDMIGLSLDRDQRAQSAGSHQQPSTGGESKCDWTSALDYTSQLVDLLIDNPEIKLCPELNDEQINLKIGPAYSVRGCVVTVLMMMNTELTRILQNTDAFEPVYVERLKDGLKLLSLVERIKSQMESSPEEAIDIENLCRLSYLCLQHRYYKHRSTGVEGEDVVAKQHLNKIDELSQFIYKRSSDQKLRLSAILMQAYSLALHDFWYRSKDLLLMSFVHDNVWFADTTIQIMYNRALVQVGMCAFRRGLIKEAHSALADIHGNNKARELLAQAIFVSRNVERNPEQERLDRQRLMPYHLHINLEVLECIYLISAMLTDLSNMSSPEFDVKKRSVSKQFYHQLRLTEKQPCYGPPDNMREHVFAAVRLMKLGKWKETSDMLINPKMHLKVWRHIRNHKQVQEFVITKIKQECLRIFIFNFSAAYDNIRLPNLAGNFDLSEKQVRTVVSKMIYNREIMASLDQPTRCLVMHRTHPSTIQMKTILLAEKSSQLIDSNDKMATFGSVGRLLGDLSNPTRKLQVR